MRPHPTAQSTQLTPHRLPRAVRWVACVALISLMSLLTAAGCDDEGDTNTDPTTADTSGTSGTDDTSGGTDDASDTATQADSTDDGDGTDPNPGPRYAFGVNPSQTVSAAPFPNDLYLSGGKVALAPLGADPVVGTLGKESLMPIFDGYIAAREGFSFAAPAFFFVQGDAEVDEASLAGRARIITLTGPEAGREVSAQAFWAKYQRAVGVMPAWGDYIMPDTTYAILLAPGATAGGEALPQAENLEAVLSEGDPANPDAGLTKAREAYAPLRAWMQANGVTPAEVAAATVFTTEPVIPYADALLDAVDAFPLVPITDTARYDVTASAFAPVEQATDPAAVEARLGTPLPPLEHYPAYTYAEARDLAATLPGGQVYEGGALRAGVGAIYTGSFVAPAFNLRLEGGEVKNTALRWDAGAPTYTHTTLVPFSLYLCESHLADPSNLPVGVFTHGGGETRIDALAVANMNCQSGVATIAPDIVFHGTRGDLVYLPTEQVIAPAGVDQVNGFTGKAEGDPGYVSDYIAEGLGATGSVGRLFSIADELDPLVIEANILMIAAENHLLTRYLAGGDWSALVPNLSFDADNIFNQSLSFGASFTTLNVALRDAFRGVVTSVASGMMLPNLAMAPNNSEAGAFLAWVFLGLDKSTPLAELKSASYKDWMLGLHLWLYERADPIAYAPYVLRHRPSTKAMSIVGTGDSWDETLHNPLQLSYAAALGLPTYHDGGAWQLDPTVPGADTIQASPLSGAATTTANVTYNGVTHTAANFFFGKACHSMLVNNFCVESHQHPYPPIVKLDQPIVALSPVCQIHTQIKGFTESLLGGAPLASVAAPQGDCATLYGSTP